MDRNHNKKLKISVKKLSLALFAVFLGFLILIAHHEMYYSIHESESNSIQILVSKDKDEDSFELARTESLGFFTDIPESAWMLHKQRFQFTQPNYDDSNKRKFEQMGRNSNHFWASNFEPEFTCPHEFRLGKLGDGGKWVCDPHRITQTNENGKCLVYSIGSNGNFMFETAVFEHVSKDCEIHTFDLKSYGRKKNFAEEANKVGVTFHHWGLGSPSRKFPNARPFKEIIVDLKHEQGTIDLMKIDCEKCEYYQYQQWFKDWKELGMTVRQVLIELHNSDLPGIVDIFNEFQKEGYVMFHKEANYDNGGNAIEAAFLLLSPEFQRKTSTTTTSTARH